jgi:glycosyltransferase involved in cell wall biosynthesis
VKRLLVASARLPPVSGGAEQVAWETSKRLTNDYEVHILTVGNKPTSQRENVKIHYVPPIRPYTLSYATVLRPKIDAEFRAISPDIIHHHIPLPWGYVFAAARCAKIVTCHGEDVYPKQDYLTRFFTKRALEKADVVTAPSRWLADYIEDAYRITCRVLPNGIDTSIFAPMKKVSPRKNVVLYVGRRVERKGIKELVEAAKKLKQYEFWFAGDPKTGSVDIPVLPNIKVLGFVESSTDLVTLFNQATLCAFPSHWENFPVVGLEAMACGKAVIATRLGFSEYIQDGSDGILIEPRSSHELIRSIECLINDEDTRKKLEHNARKKALRYDWKTLISQYRKLYEECLHS